MQVTLFRFRSDAEALSTSGHTNSGIPDFVLFACSKYTIVRLDAGRLPFETGSLSAIHAGAALHCWPNASLAVSHSFLSVSVNPNFTCMTPIFSCE